MGRTGAGCDRHDHEDTSQKKENIQAVLDFGMCARAVPLFVFNELGVPLPPEEAILKVVSDNVALRMHQMRETQSFTLDVKHVLGTSTFDLATISTTLACQVMNGPFAGHILKGGEDQDVIERAREGFVSANRVVCTNTEDFGGWWGSESMERYRNAIGFVLYTREATFREGDVDHLVNAYLRKYGHRSLAEWWRTMDTKTIHKMALSVTT
jgi:hypothetical protein